MSTYTVTGGAGFIGSSLVLRLLEAGHEVRVLDDLSAGSLSNLGHVQRSIGFVKGDIRDAETVADVVAGADCVVHLAAVASAPLSVLDPVNTTSVNVLGTSIVLDEARKAGVRRVVFAASAAAYGMRTEPIKSESLPPDPQSPYAVHKITGESLCRVFHQLYGLETVSLRFFNIYGPRQNPKSEYAVVIPRFIERYRAGKAPIIYGDGLQTRDFVYIDDLCRAVMLASADQRVGQGQIVNVGTGTSVSLLELAEILGEIFGSTRAPEFLATRPGDVKHSCADVRLAKELLGFAPTISLSEGLRRTAEWFDVAE